jgi:CTP synthase
MFNILNNNLTLGRDESETRMEIMELPTATHPYFVATQYHPEYISRPLKPSPPYLGLLLAAVGKLQPYLNNAMSSNTTSEDGENSGLHLFGLLLISSNLLQNYVRQMKTS